MKRTLTCLLLLCSIVTMAQSNLVVQGPGVTNLPEGNYGVIDIRSGATLTFVAGNYTVNNFNTNEQNIHIIFEKESTAKTGSWNFAGGATVDVKSPNVTVNAIEMQGKRNIINLYASLECNILQLLDDESILNIIGCETILTVKGTASLNRKGSVNLELGGQLHAGGMDIGAADIISGTGFIKVANNFNLNHRLTSSKNIRLRYTGHLNNPSLLGAAERADTPVCPSLPVKIKSFVVSRISDTVIEAKLDVVDYDGVDEFVLQVSYDGKVWANEVVIPVDQSNPNKVYTFTINK